MKVFEVIKGAFEGAILCVFATAGFWVYGAVMCCRGVAPGEVWCWMTGKAVEAFLWAVNAPMI